MVAKDIEDLAGKLGCERTAGKIPHRNVEHGHGLRLHHRRRRFRRLGARQPAVGAQFGNKVLLLEAGQDTPHGKVPAAILDSYPGTAYLNPAYTWSALKVTTEVIPHNRPDEPRPKLRTYEQARVLGGGSSINGQLANRGAPTDYDEWHARGATGWNWDSVLPFFKKVERDMDFDGPWHGNEGRIPVRRIFPDLWPEHAKAAGETFKSAGYEYPDRSERGIRGRIFPDHHLQRVRTAGVGGDRLSRSRHAHAREPDDIHRHAGEHAAVRRAALRRREGDGGRARDRVPRQARSSCRSGAIHSPAHLLRAGIGPAAICASSASRCAPTAPGVGQRLQDHPAVAVAAFIKPHARIINDYTRRHIYLALRYSSKLDGIPPGDMFTVVTNKTSWHAVGEQIGSFIITVYKTYSETGEVKLASRDWRDEPIVDFNLLSDQRDLERMMDGVRRFGAMHLTPTMQAVTTDPFPASYSDKVRQVGLVSKKNKWLTDALARALDGPAALRSYLIRNLIMEGVTLEGLLRDDEQLEAFVRKAAVGVWHASCTCRMGSEDDPMAVTDPAGRVRAVEGLRVVDASIFPVVPCANTNFPVLMTAEKCADAILAGA